METPARSRSDVDRFERATASEIRAAAERYLAGGRESSSRWSGAANGRLCPRSTAKVPPGSAAARAFRPPLPQVIELAGGIPLWVFPRGDLPTVTGSIVLPGGAGVQRGCQAGLAQLTVAMLDEGTLTRSAEQIALEAESMGATIDATCGWAVRMSRSSA